MKPLMVKIILMATIITSVAMRLNAQVPVPLSVNSGVNVAGKSETPVPIQNLMQFLGRWDCEVTYLHEGKSYSLNYWLDGKKTADGQGLSVEEGFTNPDLGTMQGANLAGYDPYDAKIKWFSVDNMGTTHEHIGEWLTPDHLVIVHSSVRDGKAYLEKIDFQFKIKNDMLFSLTGTLDGIETEKADGLFHKKTGTIQIDKPVKSEQPVKSAERVKPVKK